MKTEFGDKKSEFGDKKRNSGIKFPAVLRPVWIAAAAAGSGNLAAIPSGSVIWCGSPEKMPLGAVPDLFLPLFC